MESHAVPTTVSSTFSTVNVQTMTISKQQVQGMKCKSKRKELEKMSGIYADWIGDMPLLPNSSNKVESCN